MINVAMDPSQSPTHSAGENSLTVVPTPSPEALLREQLDAVTVERNSLRSDNEKLNKELKEYDTALTEMRTKLKAFEANPFSLAIANLDSGQVLQDAGDAIKNLSAAVMRRQEKGRFALAITIKPFQGVSLIFQPELKITEPKPDPVKGVFFCDEDGNISRKDPNQKEFHFGRSRMDDERFNESLR